LVKGLEVNRFGRRGHGQTPERKKPQGHRDRQASANEQRVFSPGFDPMHEFKEGLPPDAVHLLTIHRFCFSRSLQLTPGKMPF
jgi:hypothetical protein